MALLIDLNDPTELLRASSVKSSVCKITFALEAAPWEIYFVSGIFCCLSSNLFVWSVHKQRQKHCVQVEHRELESIWVLLKHELIKMGQGIIVQQNVSESWDLNESFSLLFSALHLLLRYCRLLSLCVSLCCLSSCDPSNPSIPLVLLVPVLPC